MEDPKSYLGRNKFYDQLIGGHREWLSRFDPKYLDLWDNLFKNNDPEAALCEAAVRDVFEGFDIDIEPFGMNGNDRNPDFRCIKDGEEFYVEATCISKETATRKSGLEHIPEDGKATCYAHLIKSYFKKTDNKTSQFKNLKKPAILAIGTWHFSAGQLCFGKDSAEEILTGIPYITYKINPQKGCAVGKPYQSTDLEESPFLDHRKIFIETMTPIIPTRQSISTVLLCPFGTKPVDILGILHPEPYYPFDQKILPKIEFCYLEDGWQNGKLKTKWI